MLSALSIRNIVLIDQLDIALDNGLTALTGETGAGKSILLDALTLALGGRGDASLVRHGQDNGQVVAVLQLAPDHPVRVALRENEIADDADTPETSLDRSNVSAILRACIDKLSPAHREIINLVYYHEKSVEEAGEIIGIPQSTVKTRMFYARKQLAELLKGAGVGTLAA